MSVRIVEDFWTKISEYENVIRRCFNYVIHNRYPNPEGSEEAYHDMLVSMWESKILSRFDEKKLSKGSSVSKSFEQYIFTWVNQILSEAYKKRGLHSKRYLHMSVLSERHSLSDIRVSLNETPWAQSQEEVEATRIYSEKKADRKRIKVQPLPSDVGEYVGSAGEDPLEDLSARDLYETIRGKIHTERNRKVLDLMAEGLSQQEIAEAMSMNKSTLSMVVRKIRATTKTTTK